MIFIGLLRLPAPLLRFIIERHAATLDATFITPSIFDYATYYCHYAEPLSCCTLRMMMPLLI